MNPQGRDSSNYFGRFLIICLVAITIPILLIAPTSQSQSPQQILSQDEHIRDVMMTISRQLGVTCTTCHDTNNFKSDKKVPFKVAKEHMKITQTLIDKGFDGKNGPKADCYMCHRGILKPDYREPVKAKN